ncbi:SMI1/KNR4 family protein [Chitinimonas arctica]|uniref:SMI1/KNR4 family protein n=1 Tax=Chitinimonas arctica TaxID=2594795 RepID=A0A516SMI6_9NEIS|nr:SMI1/KNR4 family protein [Chitinimonas arctica]
MLERKNGFYAFESALHIFPDRSVGAEMGLLEWNAPDLWVNSYHGMADACYFFAEDIFGGQFCLKHDGIYSFDPETAACVFLSPDLEGWAEIILNDYEVLTGYPIAQAWQRREGRLATGTRLVPKIPFVTGGEFEIENMYPLEAVKSMHFRANLATQIKDLPDGAQIKWNIID